MDPKEFGQIVEILAILCGGIGLGYWLLRGAFVPSLRLSLEVSSNALRSNSSNDILNSTLTLENKGRVSLAIEQIRLRVVYVEDDQETEKRITPKTCLKVDGEIEPNSDWNPQGARQINLAPSDATHFGSLFRVDVKASCIVEAVVIASDPIYRKLAFKFGRQGLQWRVSRATTPACLEER